jgi:hypothetical protein
MNKFYGIDVKGEGRIVQKWFNGLSLDAQDEIINLALHLEKLPMGLWRRPEFDPLEGEGGISELRPKNIRSDEGNMVYRIYGWKRHPDGNSYTFLHGTDKEENNDLEGKQNAKWRAEQLFGGEAEPHKFDFAAEFASAPQEEQGS